MAAVCSGLCCCLVESTAGCIASLPALGRHVDASIRPRRWTPMQARADPSGAGGSRQDVQLVVSLTTTPSRIAHIAPALRSILAQTLQPARIHLYVPETCRRTQERYVLPAWLTRLAAANHHVLEITRVEEDYGPATKLLPSLSRYDRSDTRLVTVDDDVILEPHTLEELVAASVRNPHAIHGMMGVARDRRFIHAEWVAEWGMERYPVTLLGGYRSILYPRAAWDGSIWDDYRGITAVTDPFLSDDHLFAWNLLRRHVPCWVIATRYPRARLDPWRPVSCLNMVLLSLPGALNGSDDPRTAASIQALKAYYAQRGWPTTID